MKSLKKTIAILLCLAMVLSLAACGGESGSSTADGSSQSSESSESTGSTEGESSSEAEGGDAAATGEFKLPIVDEPVELSYFVSASTNAAIVTTDYNDNEFYQEMERRTGVHLNFEMVSSADYQTG